MAGVSAGLDHRDPHARSLKPVRGHPGERGADSAALVTQVDRDHVDLPDAGGVVQHGRYETDRFAVYLRYPHPIRGVGEHVADLLGLVGAPLATEQEEGMMLPLVIGAWRFARRDVN